MQSDSFNHRLHNVLSIAVMGCICVGVYCYGYIKFRDFRNPFPEHHFHVSCMNENGAKVLRALGDKSPEEQIEFWAEQIHQTFEAHVPAGYPVSSTERWIVDTQFCDRELNKLTVVSYRGKIEPIRVDGSEIYASNNYHQLDYNPLDDDERVDYQQTGFWGGVTGFGLFVLSYLLFGGIRLRFWDSRRHK